MSRSRAQDDLGGGLPDEPLPSNVVSLSERRHGRPDLPALKTGRMTADEAIGECRRRIADARARALEAEERGA